ncbi:hypothetical protein ACT80S_15010 [Ramlibacter sp. MAHUQ-53]|uniref:hypothetical protein n=1 Tax=unclassified Ramlibacter TaxID=2617605 RepID=UPI00363BBA3A
MSIAKPLPAAGGAELTLNTFREVARECPPGAVLTVEGNQLTVLGKGSLSGRDVAMVGPTLAIRSFRAVISEEISPFASQTITSRHGLADASSRLEGHAVEALVAEAQAIQQQRDLELVMLGVADADRFRALGKRPTD